MSWLFFALSAAFFTALLDFFIKLAAGKIHEGFGGFVINFAAAVVLIVFIILAKLKGEAIFDFKTSGLVYSILGGVAIGIATICFLKMFALGTNFSIGVPLYRVGTVLIAILLATFFLKESLSLRYLVGFVLSLIGLYLLVTK